MAFPARPSVCLAVTVLAFLTLGLAEAAPAPTPSPIWRLFGGFGGYNGGGGGGFGQRGSRAYDGPPPQGPNEYKSICRVNNPDNYAAGPGHIPVGPVCPW